ncbi:hypothetical protein Tcan_15618 [Toxocara canis]|uniref:G-protein coupled receptors family 1 profile domain-containing protein n=1 Tax=Toxocara canis TaxID=6265 RepID=A0A0B2VBU6_TOXCA|nr:hypothetical protein Tcan_15618 [Toxocara canis]
MNALDQCQTVIVQLPAESIVYEWLYGIHTFYRPIHTYLSIFMCAVGTICNFCNIVVLTRKQMRTPVNMILTAMACCDTVVLFSNLIYTTHYTFVAFANCHPRHWSYGWAMFLIAHAHLSLVGHSSSVWLSVMLALIRYMTLRSRGNMNGVQIGLRHSYMAIGFVVLFVAVMNAPNFLTYKIIEMRLNETCEIKDESVRYAPAYIPGVSDMAVQAYCLVFRMAFWISGTVFKVVPCLLLTLFVWLLMRILNEVKQNRIRLMKNSRPLSNGNSSKIQPDDDNTCRTPSKQANHIRSGERTDRTTRMLLAIVFVFLVTEMPQGVMAVLSGMFSEEFRRHIYNNLGDILDLLSLCGACTTFIIYCSMSGQFRNEFRRVFLPSSVTCLSTKSDRRFSEPLVKSCYLRPSDGLNDNASTSDRSITMAVVESAGSVRKVTHAENVLPTSACTNSLTHISSLNSTDVSPTLRAPHSTAVDSQPPSTSTFHETLDDKSERVDEKTELLSDHGLALLTSDDTRLDKKQARLLEARYHIV